MSRKFLCGAVVVFVVAALSLPADAGRRHHRSYSSSCGHAAGNWYHFTSGGGSYIPFATKPVTHPSGASWQPVTRSSTYSAPVASPRTSGTRSVSPTISPRPCRSCF